MNVTKVCQRFSMFCILYICNVAQEFKNGKLRDDVYACTHKDLKKLKTRDGNMCTHARDTVVMKGVHPKEFKKLNIHKQ